MYIFLFGIFGGGEISPFVFWKILDETLRQVDKLYAGLKDLANERRAKLDDALKLFRLNREVTFFLAHRLNSMIFSLF